MLIQMKAALNVCEILMGKLSDKMKTSTSQMTDLAKSCPLVHYEKSFSKDEIIFGPYDTKDKIFVVRQGEVEIYQLSPDGKKAIIDIMVPGDIFANSSFSFESDIETNDFAQARSRVVLYILQKSDFLSVLGSMPSLAIGLIEELSARLCKADGRIRNLALSDAKTKLVNELIRLGAKAGKEYDGKIVLGTRFTHEELAEMTGAARETVTRTLGELRHKKAISFDDHRHIVIDKQKVRDLLL